MLETNQKGDHKMITNNICKNCEHSTLCKLEDKISIFSEDAKKQLGIDITMDKCDNFKEVEL